MNTEKNRVIYDSNFIISNAIISQKGEFVVDDIINDIKDFDIDIEDDDEIRRKIEECIESYSVAGLIKIRARKYRIRHLKELYSL